MCARLEQDEDVEPGYSQQQLWDAEPQVGGVPQASGAPPAGRAAQVHVPDQRGEMAAAGAGGRTGFHAAPVADPQLPQPPERAAVPDLVADMAGWSSGELPGQASAGLAAWPAAAAEGEGERRGTRGIEPRPRQHASPEGAGQHASPEGAGQPEAQGEQKPSSPDPTGWLRLA
jgi:hypothetical protein